MKHVHIIIALGMGLAGCVENPGSLIIVQGVTPEDTEDISCAIESSEDYVGEGTVDALALAHGLRPAPPGYLLFPEILSNVASSIDRGRTQPGIEREQNRIDLSRFEVEVEYAPDPEIDPLVYNQLLGALFPGGAGYQVPYRTSIFPGGRVLAIVEILPASVVELVGRLALDPGLVRCLSAGMPDSCTIEPTPDAEVCTNTEDVAVQTSCQLLAQPQKFFAHVKVFGTMRSNEVESNTFSFPVDVCSGCLIVGLEPPVACSAMATVPQEQIADGSECNGYPQDEPLNCCWARDGDFEFPVCPARGAGG